MKAYVTTDYQRFTPANSSLKFKQAQQETGAALNEVQLIAA